MTALVTVYLKRAILMSADSLEIEIDSYETQNIIGMGITQKLFLIESSGTGISVGGFSGWDDKSVADILREFVNSASLTQKSQTDIATDLSHFLSKNYPRLQSRFHLSGFDGGEPVVMELVYISEGNWKLTRKNARSDGTLDNHFLAMCEKETARHFRLHPPGFDAFAIDDAVAFIRKLYEREIDLVTRIKNPPDVAEPIDILVIFPGGHWFESIKNREESILDRASPMKGE